MKKNLKALIITTIFTLIMFFLLYNNFMASSNILSEILWEDRWNVVFRSYIWTLVVAVVFGILFNFLSKKIIKNKYFEIFMFIFWLILIVPYLIWLKNIEWVYSVDMYVWLYFLFSFSFSIVAYSFYTIWSLLILNKITKHLKTIKKTDTQKFLLYILITLIILIPLFFLDKMMVLYWVWISAIVIYLLHIWKHKIYFVLLNAILILASFYVSYTNYNSEKENIFVCGTAQHNDNFWCKYKVDIKTNIKNAGLLWVWYKNWVMKTSWKYAFSDLLLFSTIEEFGILWWLILLAFYIYFISYIYKLYKKNKNIFVLWILIYFSFQILVSLGITLWLIPYITNDNLHTRQSLPFTDSSELIMRSTIIVLMLRYRKKIT